MATDTEIKQLILNVMKKEQYEEAKESGSINPTELYFVDDDQNNTESLPPSVGGGGENLNVRLVASVTIDPANPPESIIIDRDNDGNPFELRKVLIFSDLKSNVSYTHFTINGAPWSYGLRIKHGAAGISTAYFADDFMYCACDGYINGQIVGYKTAGGGVANENYFGSAKSFQFLPAQGYSGGTFIYIFEVL